MHAVVIDTDVASTNPARRILRAVSFITADELRR